MKSSRSMTSAARLKSASQNSAAWCRWPSDEARDLA
jgi:hypothetical protein